MHLTHYEEMVPTKDGGKEKRNLEAFTHGQDFFLRIGTPDNPQDFDFNFVFDEQSFLRFYEGLKSAGEYMAWLK